MALGQVGGHRAERAYTLLQRARAPYQIVTKCSWFFETDCKERGQSGVSLALLHDRAKP